MRRKVPQALLVLCTLLAGSCSVPPRSRAPAAPPPADFVPTRIDYVDSDAFDTLLESALVNRDPVIIIQTPNRKPDWGGRLNAWIAAWNRGGPVDPAPRTARGQIPIPGVKVDEGTLREFRLLVGGLMDRVDVLARDGSAWWAEERVRTRRVALLKPYDLRFHLGEGGDIDLVFFNGNYASSYPDFVRSLTGAPADTDEPEKWARTFRCSRCRALRDKERAAGTLTGQGGDE